MTFWDSQDLSAPVNPAHAATLLGNMLSILSEPGDPINDLATAPSTSPTPSADGASTNPTATAQPFEGTAPTTGTFGEDRGGHIHAGIDFGVPSNTAIMSVTPGTVVQAGDDGSGYGVNVIVDYGNGNTILYGHLSSTRVAVGDAVSPGQLLGLSGSTGRSTGPHLHLEARANGQPIDPTALLAGGQPMLGKVPADDPNADPEPYTPQEIATFLTSTTPSDPINDLANDAITSKKRTAATSAKASGDFFGRVLAGVGAPDTPENRRALRAWQQAEGGSADNPFNTMQGAPGATQFNDAGVKRYPDVATGVRATVQTLLNGHYDNILTALRSGTDAMAVADAIAASPWGSGALVREVLNG